MNRPLLSPAFAIDDAEDDAATERAKAEHEHRLRTDREYLESCYRDACDDLAALKAACERAIVVCAEARTDEERHPGAALGGLVAIKACLTGAVEECR